MLTQHDLMLLFLVNIIVFVGHDGTHFSECMRTADADQLMLVICS